MGNCYNKKTHKYDYPDDRQLTKRLNMSKKNITFKKQKNIQFRNKQEILTAYKIQKQIGSGLFSKVYSAYNKQGKQVALKIIKKKQFQKKSSIHKILLEKQIMQMMKHENILKLNKTFQSKSTIFLEMEFAELGSLLKIINTKTEWTYKEIQYIAAQIIEGLFYMHSKQIIYGDLKAENILLNEKGVVKICDFNLSGTVTILKDQFQGTAVYMPPELIKHNHKLFVSDFWSLGVLLHLICYRKYPFKKDNRQQLFNNITKGRIIPENCNREIDPKMRQFILDLLVVDPTKRLGQNFQQIIQHQFFKNFDWNNYKNENTGTNIVKQYKILLKEKMKNKQKNVEKMNTLLEESKTSFMYNISQFTYNENQIHDQLDSQSTGSTEPYQLIKVTYFKETKKLQQ